jgi:hypothetical protein
MMTTSPSPADAPALHPTSHSERNTSQQAGYSPKYNGYWDDEAKRATRSVYKEPLSGHNNMQRHSNASAYVQSPYEFSPRTSGKSANGKNPRDELEKEYERGMQATYDEHLEMTHLVITNVVMKTPAEVALGFQVCTRKIQAVLWPRGMERAPLLVDIAGLVIGGDATTAWGQSLKTCWDRICAVVGKDRYLAAHYNSRASQPDKEQLQEKIRRIQFMTSAVLNDFQSNIFDTREEAIAFLQRMRELNRV